MYQCFSSPKKNMCVRCRRRTNNPSHRVIHFCHDHQPSHFNWRPFPVCVFRFMFVFLLFVSPSMMMNWNSQKVHIHYEKCDFTSQNYLLLRNNHPNDTRKLLCSEFLFQNYNLYLKHDSEI